MSIYPPGGHSLVWPMKVCAAGQRMVLNKTESLVLNWVCILEFFCSNSAAHPYPNLGQVPPQE